MLFHGHVPKPSTLQSRSGYYHQGSGRGRELYGVCLVYWIQRRGYEGPSCSLEIGPLEEEPRFMASGNLG